jgi:hypothetical protein
MMPTRRHLVAAASAGVAAAATGALQRAFAQAIAKPEPEKPLLASRPGSWSHHGLCGTSKEAGRALNPNPLEWA